MAAPGPRALTWSLLGLLYLRGAAPWLPEAPQAPPQGTAQVRLQVHPQEPTQVTAQVSTPVDAQVDAQDQLKVRLVNGSSRCVGRVEVLHKHRWGSVCDDTWDMADAQVICRHLGCGSALAAPGHAHFGQGAGPIWLDGTHCTGEELTLARCQLHTWGEHNCAHSEDAGAVCSGVPRCAQVPTPPRCGCGAAPGPARGRCRCCCSAPGCRCAASPGGCPRRRCCAGSWAAAPPSAHLWGRTCPGSPTWPSSPAGAPRSCCSSAAGSAQVPAPQVRPPPSPAPSCQPRPTPARCWGRCWGWGRGSAGPCWAFTCAPGAPGAPRPAGAGHAQVSPCWPRARRGPDPGKPVRTSINQYKPV
ncbi:soluble scavenger receptor cysteine-rich domain-containing protein SSC5D-like isoform X4 [Vidua macroura]|uniref:soluble scavenger receptor cysteine-rich domain-containing protein SSC5D-like isoform X4 n=1 Tax=Vidua macroura TaxID=187451 RepID=UPI0023A835D7|nr:soluble scavenger receptor cysteine-rich domain-containing protein SSC5D-like isoform X4 [Vidua macroura]